MPGGSAGVRLAIGHERAEAVESTRLELLVQVLEMSGRSIPVRPSLSSGSRPSALLMRRTSAPTGTFRLRPSGAGVPSDASR